MIHSPALMPLLGTFKYQIARVIPHPIRVWTMTADREGDLE